MERHTKNEQNNANLDLLSFVFKYRHAQIIFTLFLPHTHTLTHAQKHYTFLSLSLADLGAGTDEDNDDDDDTKTDDDDDGDDDDENGVTSVSSSVSPGDTDRPDEEDLCGGGRVNLRSACMAGDTNQDTTR